MESTRNRGLPAFHPEQVPDRYIICERMDAVQLHFLFLYRDDAPAPISPLAAAAAAGAGGPAHMQQLAHAAAAYASGAALAAVPPRRRISPLLLVLLAYSGWLLYVWLMQNWPLVRRLLRRHLGIRF